jgi:hypothetical protein
MPREKAVLFDSLESGRGFFALNWKLNLHLALRTRKMVSCGEVGKNPLVGGSANHEEILVRPSIALVVHGNRVGGLHARQD